MKPLRTITFFVLFIYLFSVAQTGVFLQFSNLQHTPVQAATTATLYAGNVTVLNDSGPNWSRTGDALGNTTNTSAFVSMAQNPTVSRTLSLTDFNFESQDIPVGATINGIQVEVEWRGSNPNVQEERIQLTKNRVTGYGDNKSTGSNQTTKGITSYGGLSDLWGTTWSDTEIITEYFGVLLQYRKTGGGTRFADVYRVGITIDYTPPAEESPLTFEVTQYNRWGTGFCYQFEATNTAIYDITNWAIGFNLNGATMTSSFGTTLTDLGGGTYEYTPSAAWNDPFNVGQTIGFGFCANGGDGYVSNLRTDRFDVIGGASLQDFSFSEGDLQVDVTTSSSHGGGYCRSINIENTGAELIEGWSLSFVLDQSLTSNFSGVFTRDGSIHTVGPVGFNRVINPGQSYTLGFCTNGTNVDDIWSADILIGEPGFCGFYYEGTAAEPFEPENLLLRRIDPEIMFNWGTGSPDPIVPVDDFTASWSGRFQAQESGIHTFRTRTDDGVRLYIDGNLIINQWINQGPTIYTASLNLVDGQIYDIVMEYYERGGGAVAELDWQRPSDGGFTSLNDSRVFNTLCGENFPPTDIFLSDEFIFDGAPSGSLIGILSTEDETLGGTHSYSLVSGAGDSDNSVFSIMGDELFIDEVADFTLKTSYNIRIRTTDQDGEIFEKVFVIQVVPPGSENPGFCASYYSGTANNPFDPANILLQRIDNQIDFDWGLGSPDTAVPDDLFTARWTGYIESDETGIHEFRARTDDGVRVFIDNQNIIDQWQNQAPTFSFGSFYLDAGIRYRIIIEYYEAFGGAVAEFEWQKPSESTYSYLDGDNVFHLGSCDLSPSDTTPPVISSAFPQNNILYPSKDITLSFSYADEIGGSGIDINSIGIDLERWNGSSWIDSNSLIGNSNITISNASFEANLETYGRYRYLFSVSDNAGNIQTLQNEFFIDEPSFTVNVSEVDIGILISDIEVFSDDVTIEVETVGAEYEIILVQNQDLQSSQGGVIETFNNLFGLGYGYQVSPYDNQILSFQGEQLIVSQSTNLNTNGDKNTSSYTLQLGAMIEVLQSAGDYEGSFDVKVRFIYE